MRKRQKPGTKGADGKGIGGQYAPDMDGKDNIPQPQTVSASTPVTDANPQQHMMRRLSTMVQVAKQKIPGTPVGKWDTGAQEQKVRSSRRTVIARVAAIATVSMIALSACSSGDTGSTPLQDQLAKVKYPPEIAAMVEGSEFATETFDIPARVQDPGTVTVLWYHPYGIFDDAQTSAAVVYRLNDGRLEPLRYCRMSGGDIHKSGKGDHHPISNSIDDQTTRVYCETQEEATDRGRPNPMLIVEGKSGGFLGFIGEGDTTVREFGVL